MRCSVCVCVHWTKDVPAIIVTVKRFTYELQVEEATVRAAGTDKDQRKEIDAMLSSLGVAPVSGI